MMSVRHKHWISGGGSALRQLLLLGPPVAALGFLYLYPLSRLFWLSLFDPTLTLRNYVSLWGESSYVWVLLNTFRMAFDVTVLCLIVGYPVAYFLVWLPGRLSRLCILLVLVPLWISPLVRTYSVMVLLGREGLINQILMTMGIIESPLRIMYSGFSVRVGMVYVMLPYMALSLYSVMKGIDTSLIRASESLGASPAQAFLRVFMPLSLPGIVAGCLLVFTLSLGFYLTPALLGGSRDVTIAMVLETQVNVLLNWGLASALGVTLLLVTLGLYAVYLKVPAAGKMWGAE